MARIIGTVLSLGSSERVNIAHIAGWGIDRDGHSYVEFNGVTRREEGKSMFEVLNRHFLPDPVTHYSEILEDMAVSI